MKLLERTEYLNRLLEVKGTPDIKVITGIRRCGKSVLMKEFIKILERDFRNSNILFINLQELENENLREYRALHSYIIDHHEQEKENILIVDEIQLCKDFELAINSIHAKGIFDIYLTGSNAFLLSSDLATLFTGRSMQISVFPFSFKEYLEYNDDSGNSLNASFDEYARNGGMSGSYLYGNPADRTNYLKDLYETVLLRDLVKKYNIRNASELRKISDFMIGNTANLLSPNNICTELNKDGSSITNKTVSKYISYLCNAFLFYEVARFDIKGKKQLSSNSKFYIVDSGFRYSILGTRNMDYGHIYEGIVYLELLRRGYEVYVGKLYKKEIDFVAVRNSEKLYIQVSDNITSEETLNRELLPLKAIHDSYPKLLLARTFHEKYDIEGIAIQDLATWLASDLAISS